MDKKIVRRIGVGISIYVAFAALVLLYYPDKPDNMGWEDRQQYNKVQIAKLALGETHQNIIALLGSPDISEARQEGTDKLQVMFYRTQHKKSDGVTTQDECTPLLFKNNELIAWGEGAYQSYLNP